MKRRFQLAKALVHDPDIIILDEPTAGIDVEFRRDLWQYLRDLHSAGKTILLTTHYIEEAENLCDEVAIIDDGEIIAQGSPKDLIESDGESYINITIDKWDNNILKNYEIIHKNNMLSIKSKNTERDIPNIINELAKSNISIHKLNIKKANLEDVFIKLTGKKITDDK